MITEEKNNEFDYIKTKSFCPPKDIMKLRAARMTAKGLVSRLHKELLQNDTRKRDRLIKSRK